MLNNVFLIVLKYQAFKIYKNILQGLHRNGNSCKHLKRENFYCCLFLHAHSVFCLDEIQLDQQNYLFTFKIQEKLVNSKFHRNGNSYQHLKRENFNTCLLLYVNSVFCLDEIQLYQQNYLFIFKIQEEILNYLQ